MFAYDKQTGSGGYVRFMIATNRKAHVVLFAYDSVQQKGSGNYVRFMIMTNRQAHVVLSPAPAHYVPVSLR